MVKRLSYDNRERQQRKGALNAKYAGFSAWAVAPFLFSFSFSSFPPSLTLLDLVFIYYSYRHHIKGEGG